MPSQNPAPSAHDQLRSNAREMLAALTLEEKAGLLSGRDFWSTRPVDRLGIPSVMLTDGPHGVRRQTGSTDHLGVNGSDPATCFPPAVAVGSSWDPQVARRIGEAIGREARALGVGVVLGPGINMKRSPLCGRNFEYYSEDPALSGALGAAHVTGLQSQGVGASVKHFAANNQETERMRISADVDERTLREIYLPAFEQVITTAAPATVMAAYNRVNGVPACENRWLLTDVLRSEWGFTGAVVSDWGGVADPVASLRAGLDLEMPGTAGRSSRLIVDAVEAGELEESVVDAAAERVLALTGAPDRPVDVGEVMDDAAHHALARELATQCAVLLKNDGGVLPLVGHGTIAVIGEFARTPRFQAGGSSHVNATRIDAPLDAIREHAAARGRDVSYSAGFSLDPDVASEQLRQDAVAIARSAEIAVVFAGLAEDDESEGFDRTGLELPATQIDLIRAVAAAAPRTVVVLANGGVVTLEGWHDDVDAILEGYLLGQAVGTAIADLLFGAANPSGRLAETLPRRLQDTASFVNFPGEQGHVRYGEGVMIGYRWTETVGVPARYPFGHGLSYTAFDTSDLSVTVAGDDTAQVSVTVTNVGNRAGAHVIQLYVATAEGPVRRPARELRAFDKVHLEPGESRTVSFDLGRRAFAYWDVERSRWVVAPGAHTVQIAKDAATVLLEETILLTGDTLPQPLTLASTVQEWFTHQIAGPDLQQALDAAGPEGPALTPELVRMIGSMPMKKVIDMLSESIPAAFFDSLMGRSAGASNGEGSR